MQLIEDYIALPKQTRQEHLDLSSACIERGGPKRSGLSTYCKGLLAHLLDTTMPSGHTILVCHACHNSKCSNPNHLYWGTAKENTHDAMMNGRTLNCWERTVLKYGLQAAKQMQSNRRGGAGNKDGTKSVSHKSKISLSVRQSWVNRKNKS